MSLFKQNLSWLGLGFFALLFFVFPHISFSAGLVQCGGPGEAVCKVSDLFIIIARLTTWLIRLAGVYAIYKIVGAGFNLVTALGEEEKITKAKEGISNAVVGFVLVMMAYMFVSFMLNFFMLRGVPSCKIDISKPLNYLTVDENYYNQCRADYEKELQQGILK